MTELAPLREAVASYACRAAEKLRAQGDVCQLLQVYIRTGVFNPDEPRYARTASVPLHTPSNDSRDLVQAALAGLEGIYRPGYRYQKAGVMLMNLASPGQVQADLFAPAPRPRSAALMATVDRINTNMGRGTVRLARVPALGGWSMKQELRSPGYTCRWDELPRVL
ncbi:DUF4113 domain-containing protein [Pseudomonas aeruginosa]